MTWWGWFDADPFLVHLSSDGWVEIRVGDREIHRSRLLFLDGNAANPEQESEAIRLLPGATQGPARDPWSWVNERGRGQIILTRGVTIACRLHRRLPKGSSLSGGDSDQSQRHPLAGFWLSIAASIHTPLTIESLSSLSGYSYPTCHEWVRTNVGRGFLRDAGGEGRQRRYRPTVQALQVWWKDLATWWPSWRTPQWPLRHGRVEVVYARFEHRLPSQRIGSTDWPNQDPLAGMLWATGADHLSALGELVQTYDTDVWCTQRAWQQAIREIGRDLKAPKEDAAWSGTRLTLMPDNHPLLRLLWFSAGVVHPSVTTQTELWNRLQRRDGLLLGLPLLDAIASEDARVVERGQQLLSVFSQTLDAP